MTRLLMLFLLIFNYQVNGKINDDKVDEAKINKHDAAGLLFADELRVTLEKYLLGICPQPYKSRWSQMVDKRRNSTISCDLDPDQNELAGRLATLALHAHSASRTDCLRFGAAIANTLGELARTAANSNMAKAAAANDLKKRKLSKSQKLKIQAKQRTALAVKKKAAAAAAAKMAS